MRSPPRREMPKFLRAVMSRALEPEGFEIVEGRRRMVRWTGYGWEEARAERWVSVGRPSSPAPRTRMERAAVGRALDEEDILSSVLALKWKTRIRKMGQIDLRNEKMKIKTKMEYGRL
jgi:hypothetical protein